MAKVWLAQCLCPQRHAICAMVGECENRAEAETITVKVLWATVDRLVKDGQINPWCAICAADKATWRYEVVPTRFESAEAAMPHLIELQAGNQAANALFGDLHLKGKPN